jgi:hypothetical protein
VSVAPVQRVVQAGERFDDALATGWFVDDRRRRPLLEDRRIGVARVKQERDATLGKALAYGRTVFSGKVDVENGSGNLGAVGTCQSGSDAGSRDNRCAELLEQLRDIKTNEWLVLSDEDSVPIQAFHRHPPQRTRNSPAYVRNVMMS